MFKRRLVCGVDDDGAVQSLRSVGPPNDPTAALHRVWLPTDDPQGAFATICRGSRGVR